MSAPVVAICIVGALAVLLLGRELVCWYLKINARLREAENTNEYLKFLDQKLARIGTMLEKATGEPPQPKP